MNLMFRSVTERLVSCIYICAFVEEQIISCYSLCPPSSLKYALNSQVAFLIVERYEMARVLRFNCCISPEWATRTLLLHWIRAAQFIQVTILNTSKNQILIREPCCKTLEMCWETTKIMYELPSESLCKVNCVS